RAIFSAPALSRRSRSSALRRAVVASQPPGFGGTPSRGQCSTASTNASCTASSASPRSPVRAASAALIRVASSRYARSRGSPASIAAGFHAGPRRGMTEFRLAERMGRLGTESAFEVLAKAKALEAAGQTIVHLEIGEPDFPTAPHIVDAAVAAMQAGHTHYVPAPGIPALREAVAAFLERTGRMRVSPDRV